jgi:hypothetical protein
LLGSKRASQRQIEELVDRLVEEDFIIKIEVKVFSVRALFQKPI